MGLVGGWGHGPPSASRARPPARFAHARTRASSFLHVHAHTRARSKDELPHIRTDWGESVSNAASHGGRMARASVCWGLGNYAGQQQLP